MRLHEVKNKVEFEFSYSPMEDVVTLFYKIDNSEEDFSSFLDFVGSLGLYYKRIIENEIDPFLKFNYCNSIIKELQNYLYFFAKKIKQRSAVENETNRQIEHFKNLRNGFQTSAFIENENLSINKIKWKASPAILGYLFNELAHKGFIEMPKHGTEDSYTGYAKQFMRAFQIEDKEEYYKNVFNPRRNTLSESKKHKFNLPDLSDLQ